MLRSMKFVSIMSRLLMLAAVLGLMAAPVSIALASGAMASSVFMTDVDAAAEKSDNMSDMMMAQDMPCLADLQSMKMDCSKNCLLVTLCTTSISTNLPNAVGVSVTVSWMRHIYGPAIEAQLTSAALDPPVRPPRG